MKPRLVLLLIASALMIGKMPTSQAEAQGGVRLQLPFTGTYRLTSYVDHQSPLDPGDNTIIMFNGEEYSNCPASTEQWTTQGPYCYDGHEGIDWAMVENTPVLAAASGVVNEADADNNLGNFIIIDHGSGYETLYAHLNNFATGLDVGDEVDTGDLIGYSGDTGNSGGPHLHFETLHNGLQTDPFGWNGNTADPLVNYSGEAAICLWDNEGCHETIVEDGDNSSDGTVKFQQVGNDWSSSNWTVQGNSWTMKYLASGDGSSYALYWPQLSYPGPYQVFAFIPASNNTAQVTYEIYVGGKVYNRIVNQASYTNQWVSLGTHNFNGGFFDYIKLSNNASSGQIAFDTLKFRQFRSYLPIVSNSEAVSPPPPSGCYMGRVLSNDTFEGGGNDGPFVGNGTDTVHQVRWERDNNSQGNPFPALPGKVSLEDHGQPPDEDGIRFADKNDNQAPPNDLSDQFDQAIWRQIGIPAHTKRIDVAFDLLMKGFEHPPGHPLYTGEVYDRIFFDLQKFLGEGDSTSAEFECNNTMCNLIGTENYIREGWFRPVIPIPLKEDVQTDEFRYITFWVNVNSSLETSFFIDNFTITIRECY